MSLKQRISDAYGKIYDRGDNGLEYMDKHEAMDEPTQALMEHFYNDTLEKLGNIQRFQLAKSLETIVDDMEFDLETL
jgi:glycerol dehydrogenase-like iron-containing ADH family enzyme